ncbi:MAG: hypothetical protein Kow0022_13830 [Phycisphaerales bacterium]
MVVATLVIKTLSFFATWVLGTLLSKDDYGVYGIAMGLAAFAQVLRDGGMRQILIQKRAHRYAKLSGPMFWFSGAFNGGAGLLLGLAALPISRAYGEPELAPVLWATATSIALATPSGVLRAKIAVDLKFSRLAQLNTWSAAVRYTSMIACAAAGLGALSFTIPLVLIAIFEAVYGYAVTRDTPWMRRPRLRLWPALWGRSKWLILGTLGMTTLRQGDYLVLGWLKAGGYLLMGVVGQYVFAYQAAVQINVLVAVNLQQVLFPALSKLAGEPQRHAQAVLRATRVMMLAGSGLGLSLACTIKPLQVMLWGGKWDGAVWAVIWMSMFFPLRLLTSVLNATQMSKARFKDWFWLTLLQGAGMMGAAAIGGLVFCGSGAEWVESAGASVGISEAWLGNLLDGAGAISFVIGMYFLLGVAPTVVWGLHRCGIHWRKVAPLILPTWVVSCAAAGATMALAQVVPMPAELPMRWAALLEVIERTAVFGVLDLALLRLFTPGTLAEAVEIVPRRLRRLVRRVLGLPEPARALRGAAEEVAHSAEPMN